MNLKSLLYTPVPRPSAKFRVICFPYAGGNASTYSSWIEPLHKNAELTVVQLPGRSLRFVEPFYETMHEMVQDIDLALNNLTYKQNVFFGHSMGAKIAYELTVQRYSNQSTLPSHLIASGCSAPSVPYKGEFTFNLPDEKFIEKLRDMNGTPENLIRNADLISLLLPMLRADFRIAETYINKTQRRIPTILSIFAAEDDDLKFNDVEPWTEFFTENTGIDWFKGGHFFIENNRDQVLKKINQIIKEADCA